MTDVHVHAPTGIDTVRELTCRRCKRPRRHLVTLFVWYGPMTTCLACGAFRNDGVLRRARASDGVTKARARVRAEKAIPWDEAVELVRREALS